MTIFKRILLAFFLLAAPAAFAQTSTINGSTTFQTIDGFGAATEQFSTPMTTGYATTLFSTTSGAGLSILRVEIQDDGSCASVGINCAGNAWPTLADMGKAATVNPSIIFWGVPWTPPVSMKTNGNLFCDVGTGAGKLITGDYSLFATYLSNWAKSVAAQGFTPYGISPQNEPDFCPTTYGGANWNNSDLHTFVGNLHSTLVAQGQSAVQIIMPEAAHYSGFTALANTTMGDPTTAAEVGVLTFHGYDNPSSPTNPYSGPHWWQTEVSCGPGFGPCGGSWDPSMNDALNWAGIIHTNLVVGKENAWLYWRAVNNNTTDNQGLINSAGVVSKRLWALGNWARFVRPGWVMIGATNNPQAGVQVSAFKDPATGNFAIVAINTNSGSTSQPFALSGLSSSTVTPYLTDANGAGHNLAAQTVIPVSGNAFTASLAAQSVTTFYSTGGGGSTQSFTTAVSPAASGTVVCSPPAGAYSTGTSVTCTATAASGFVFSSFSGLISGGTNPQTFALNSSGTVTANFTASGGSTINAATCSQADILAALNSVTATTTVVNVPAGVCNYTTQLIWTRPSANTNLTIKGQTVVTCTGTSGTSSYACTATDNTVIKDSIASNVNPIQITMSGNNPFLFTGFTIEGGTGVVKNNGILIFNGPNHKFRVAYNHFDVDTYSTSFSTFNGRLFGDLAGVLDHNIYDNGHASTLSQGFAISSPYNDTIGNGDGPWAQPENFGSQEFIVIEDSIMNWGELEDCDTGAKFVARYNSINFASAGSAPVHAHGTKSQAGAGRGCRAYEAYMNWITGPPGTSYDAVFGSAGGPSLVWGNTIARGFNWGAAISATRPDCSATETNTPNGWGYCGTAAKIPSACTTANGVGSNWDGNSGANGWPCLDGIGRGKGQALNGAGFPGRLNSVTGTISWPQQLLVPTYYFMNSYGVAAALRINGNDASTVNNRDVYFEAGSSVNTGCTSAFNGSCGTGFGLRSARPTSCTPGPGGTYGTSPTGSYGVAWFSTDLNTLSVCTALNVWTDVYTPLVHPHPLVSGTTPVSDPVLSPTPGTFTGSQSVSITDSTSGATIYYTLDGTTPTTSSAVYSVPLTIATTTTVKTFAALTGMSNSNVVTGVYTINLATCPDPHQKAPWFSATYHVPNITLPVVVDWTEADATCTMRYTSDGSVPLSSSPIWPSGGINLFSAPAPDGITYRVKAFSTTGGSDSGTQGGQWIIIFDLPATFPSLMQGLPQY